MPVQRSADGGVTNGGLSRGRSPCVPTAVDPQSDAVLVRRLKTGDAAAFDEAYARFNPRLHAFLARLMGRRDLAEDLLQETWMRLATRAAALRDDTRLGAWLFTVARNLTLSFRRWRALDNERLAILHLRDDPTAASAFDVAAASQTERRLEAALLALPAKYREVLLLVGVEGMEREDAAAVLGLRPEALRQRLARARIMIKLHLEIDEAVTVAGEKDR
jgi:RNA polymerase sigma-70 factor (ECF subfamily)